MEKAPNRDPARQNLAPREMPLGEHRPYRTIA